jgi:hypothetical protein
MGSCVGVRRRTPYHGTATVELYQEQHRYAAALQRLIDGWLNPKGQDEAATPNLALDQMNPIPPTGYRVPEHTTASSGL